MKKLTAAILNEIERDLGTDAISLEKDMLEQFGQDWTRYYRPNPQAILFPDTTDQVRLIVQWARRHKIALVPSGGRTGLSGGAVAANGEVVVTLHRMNKILEFNRTNQIVSCEAGVITETLQQYVKEKNFYFPVDFAARGSSMIGGNIATNAGGIKVFRYGLMRQWVAGLKVVTGTGEILNLNRSLVKNATGYDLRQLFIGSEGTLGVITEASLHFTQQPGELNVMVLGFDDLQAVGHILAEFRSHCSLMAFELFSNAALDHVIGHSDLAPPLHNTTAYYLLVEFEISHPDSLESALAAFDRCLDKGWVLDGVMNQNHAQFQHFWRLREDITEALAQFTPYKNDIAVTVANVSLFMQECNETLKQHYPHFEVVWFGHVGDGNLHISILKPADWVMEEFVAECRKVDQHLYEVVKKFEGSISAEHGVGLTKKPFLHYTRSNAEIQFMKSIKNIFDPDGILNPGKIF